MGHRPAPSDSLPLIGEVAKTGVFAAFGHHHIGLTGGPKTGRLIAAMLSGQRPNIDMSIYAPDRFARRSATAEVTTAHSTKTKETTTRT